MQVDFGNPGNRFVGRHFLDVDLHHSDDSGDQFKLLWHTALTGISDGRTDDYNEETLSWARVTTSGVWGPSGTDRKGVVLGRGVSVRVELVGRSIINKKKMTQHI